MTPALVAQTLALLDIGVLAAFTVHSMRLRRKRMRLERVSGGEEVLRRVLGVVAAGAIISLLIGYSAAGIAPSIW